MQPWGDLILLQKLIRGHFRRLPDNVPATESEYSLTESSIWENALLRLDIDSLTSDDSIAIQAPGEATKQKAALFGQISIARTSVTNDKPNNPSHASSSDPQLIQ